MQHVFSILHKGELFAIYEFREILLFPHSAVSLFPRNEGIQEISNEKIVRNIQLTMGLAKKNRITYERFKRETQKENDRIIQELQNKDDLDE